MFLTHFHLGWCIREIRLYKIDNFATIYHYPICIRVLALLQCSKFTCFGVKTLNIICIMMLYTHFLPLAPHNCHYWKERGIFFPSAMPNRHDAINFSFQIFSKLTKHKHTFTLFCLTSHSQSFKANLIIIKRRVFVFDTPSKLAYWYNIIKKKFHCVCWQSELEDEGVRRTRRGRDVIIVCVTIGQIEHWTSFLEIPLNLCLSIWHRNWYL